MSTRISSLQKLAIARRIGRCVCAVLVVLFAAAPVTSHAFHFPWDQGHDTTDWDDPPDDGPCEGPQCDPCSSTGSPVYIPTGHFIWTETDLSIAGQPALSLTRTYNSNDPRDGLFGRGWTTNCDAALLQYVGSEFDATDGVVSVSGYVLRSADGKRYSFRRSPGGAIVAPSGRFERIVPQANGDVRVFSRSGSSRTYSSTGRLVSASSQAGHVLSYSYDASGRLQRITNPAGRFIAFTYNSRGRVEALNDSASRTWSYAYDANGSLISITNPAGGIRRFEYRAYTPPGSAHTYYQLTRITDETGVVVTDVAYNGERVASYTEGENRFSYIYNTTTRTVTKTDSMNSQWVYTYTDAGKIASIRDPLANTERFEFDANGNTTLYVDQLQNEWRWTYDEQGRITSTTDPLGARRTYNYSGDRVTPLSSTSPTGRVTQAEFDSRDRLIALTGPSQGRTEFGYGTGDNLTSIQDAAGNSTQLTTDPSGLPLTVRDALGRTTTLSYDGAGKLRTLRDPAGNVKTIEYDNTDAPSAVVLPTGRRTQMIRDSAGRATSIVDAAGATIRFEFDSYGRESARVLTDGRRYEFGYRSDNLLQQVTRPDGVIESFSYDAAKRLTSKSFAGQTATFAYDARGDMTNATNAAGTVSRQYDAAGRITSETFAGHTVSSIYNGEGERTQLTGPGGTISYGVDTRGLVTSMQAPEGQYVFGYDAMMRRNRIDYPNGTSTRYTYDAASQLTQLDSVGPFTESIAYELDSRGLIARATSNVADRSYVYDDDGRLIRTSAGATVVDFPVDPAGNVTGNGRVYDAANRLTIDNDFTYSYDQAGRLVEKRDRTSGARTTYEWNGAGELVTVLRFADASSTQPSESVQYAYDALGRRVSRTSAEVTQRFIYDGLDPIAAIDSSGAVIDATTFGLSIDEPLALNGSEGTRFLHADSLGSIIAVSDSGALRGRYEYAPYGMTLSGPADVSNPYRYTAREYEAEDLYYYRARYYDPGMGRFISEDPLGPAGGINLYLYANGDPINNADPTGECPWCVAVVIGGLIGGGIDLTVQLIQNGGNLSCVDWGSVGTSALLGAAGSAIGGAPMLSRAGREFSHWIPARYFRPSSPSYKPWIPKWVNGPLNGNYTTPMRHYRHDPFRYPPGWRDMGDRLNPALRQLDRTPDWLKGAAAGGGAGAATGGDNCECQ